MVEGLRSKVSVVDSGEDKGLEKVEETQEGQAMKYSNSVIAQSPC